MPLSQKLEDAVILKTQIINDLKNGVSDGAGLGGFQAAMAEITRLGIKALKKYLNEK